VHSIELLTKAYERDGFDCVFLPSNELELFLPVKTIQEALAPHP
jgi:hypothetical protein